MTTMLPDPSSEQLLAANEDAATFFRRQLLSAHHRGPRTYLIERGFAQLLENTRWTVGFAPSGWTNLREHLSELGYSDQTLVSAGLLAEGRRGAMYDRFRGRIIFGIRNSAGELVGFTARSAPGDGGHVPKYLNTPRTTIFDKSAELFGLAEQLPQDPGASQVVIVEGPLDAIAVDLSKQGPNAQLLALALCGTALSATHANRIQTLDPTATLVVLDEDGAGCAGRERAYLQLRHRVDALLCPLLPRGQDPAEVFLKAGAPGLRTHLSCTRQLADQLVDDRLASWPNLNENAEARVACLRETAVLVAGMRTTDLTHQAGRLAGELDLSQETVTRELADRVARPPTCRSAHPGPAR